MLIFLVYYFLILIFQIALIYFEEYTVHLT